MIEGLQFEPSWRFTSPGSVPRPVVNTFFDYIEKIASQGNTKDIYETFKAFFSGGGHHSSSLSWARSDLIDAMAQASENAPMFIDAFYRGCQYSINEGLGVPDVNLINTVLSEHKAGYEIRPPHLIPVGNYAAVEVPERAPSFAVQARSLIEEALSTSTQLLNEGKGRQAVSELLWLLETIVTAFRGVGSAETTLQGKYFVDIIKEMKANNRGKAQEQILKWMTTLYGYLSSPTGGGVRHGTDLQDGIAIQLHEARLYCNLIRSYITFMIEEHERHKNFG